MWRLDDMFVQLTPRRSFDRANNTLFSPRRPARFRWRRHVDLSVLCSTLPSVLITAPPLLISFQQKLLKGSRFWLKVQLQSNYKSNRISKQHTTTNFQPFSRKPIRHACIFTVYLTQFTYLIDAASGNKRRHILLQR